MPARVSRQELTPVSFLERSGMVHAERTAVVDGAVRTTCAVLECAVIAVPDDTWGEVPKAFVTLRPGRSASEADLIAHCRARIARYKAPRSVVFGPLPRTSTGKIQKYVLREREWQGRDKRIN